MGLHASCKRADTWGPALDTRSPIPYCELWSLVDMQIPSPLLSAVAKPDALVFPENLAAVQTLAKRMDHLIASPEAGGTAWRLPDTSPSSGPRVLVTATGHGMVYSEHGQRIL